MTDIPDYPLSIFRDAIASTVGRVLSFILVCLVAPLVPFIVFSLCGATHFRLVEAADLLHAEAILWLSMVFFRQVLWGVHQGWGLIASAGLGLLFAGHVWWEWRAGATLLAVFLVASMESLRVEAQDRGLRALPLAGILVFLAVWLCGLAALVVLLSWRRKTTIPSVPLTGCRR
jgi:hypothetical protein